MWVENEEDGGRRFSSSWCLFPLWISGGAAAQPKHNPAPAEESTWSSPRGATAGVTNEEKKRNDASFCVSVRALSAPT